MPLLRHPGVHRARTGTEVLIDELTTGGHARGRHVLDVGNGTGAVAAARAGAASVTAVAPSWRSVTATRLDARRHGVTVQTRQGDLFAPVAGQRFDLVVGNAHSVPAAAPVPARHRHPRSRDAGRAVLDRICAGAGDVLTADGQVLLVHSALSGTQATIDALADAGFLPAVLARVTIPFGPDLLSRAALLERRGLIEPGRRVEELVVVCGMR